MKIAATKKNEKKWKNPYELDNRNVAFSMIATSNLR